MIMVADIKRAVAEHYGIPVKAMTQSFGVWPLPQQRQVAMCLAMRLTDHSFGRVGHFFGDRDPTTVRHAMEATQRRSRVDPVLHNTLRELTLQLVKH